MLMFCFNMLVMRN